jgi:hypothetical protein
MLGSGYALGRAGRGWILPGVRCDTESKYGVIKGLYKRARTYSRVDVQDRRQVSAANGGMTPCPLDSAAEQVFACALLD